MQTMGKLALLMAGMARKRKMAQGGYVEKEPLEEDTMEDDEFSDMDPEGYSEGGEVGEPLTYSPEVDEGPSPHEAEEGDEDRKEAFLRNYILTSRLRRLRG